MPESKPVNASNDETGHVGPASPNSWSSISESSPILLRRQAGRLCLSQIVLQIRQLDRLRQTVDGSAVHERVVIFLFAPSQRVDRRHDGR
jgi:hypothetical protein